MLNKIPETGDSTILKKNLQDQDGYDTGFDASQAFTGSLGDIVFLPLALNSTQITDLFQGSRDYERDSIIKRQLTSMHGEVVSITHVYPIRYIVSNYMFSPNILLVSHSLTSHSPMRISSSGRVTSTIFFLDLELPVRPVIEGGICLRRYIIYVQFNWFRVLLG
eukprot:sb/3472585/